MTTTCTIENQKKDEQIKYKVSKRKEKKKKNENQ